MTNVGRVTRVWVEAKWGQDHPLGAYDQEHDYLDSVGLCEVIVVVVVVVE